MIGVCDIDMKLVTDGDASKAVTGEFVSAFVNQTQHFGKGNNLQCCISHGRID
jgi:hypothetical protein